MSAVRLNRKMTLEVPESAPDGAGGSVDTWHERGTLWAKVTPRGGRLAKGQTGETSVSRFDITLRATPPGEPSRPAPGQRLRMGTRAFRIEAVTEAEPSGLYLICDCEEEVAK